MLGVVLLAGLGSVVGATGASAQAAPVAPVTTFAGEFHPIENLGNHKCLQPVNTGPDAPIVQATCNGSAAQGWALLNGGNNIYRFLNTSGWCMSVAVARAGSPVTQTQCASPGQTTTSNAEWRSSATLPNLVTLKSRVRFIDNNACLDVPNGSHDEGVGMQVWTCNTSTRQKWTVGFN